MGASALATTEFAALDALDIARHAARWFGVGPWHIRRWRSGTRRLPHAVGIVCNLLTMKAVTVEQVEAAAAGPVQTNGGGKREPPALPEPTPTPARADSSLSTAQKVFARAPNACCWPYGDPKDRTFRFCNNPVVKPPYCARHYAAAYVARSLSETRPGFRPSASLASSLAPVGVHECPAHSRRFVSMA